ncbi:MAG: hypothetical protein H0W65_02920 [Sphingomonas sp.]|uniref:hypothetical protein n=1 Tax=Sphingomonas sp. TaxID=28214 RepID=UPI0017BE9DCB|nr:hypothetical protein [Sphingomonas sp.]MBA3666660.1 hypothetical protein [Sphingomonas sp.]
MRHLIIALSVFTAATPALAAPRYAPPPPMPGPDMERALNDPAMADQIGRVAGVLTKSLMNLPVGEIEAAIEGRPPTPYDRARTVRDEVGDPYLEQRVAAEAAQSGRTMQAAGRAMMSSLPAIMGALGQAQDAIERAVANMPSPTYPRR